MRSVSHISHYKQTGNCESQNFIEQSDDQFFVLLSTNASPSVNS